ncbi:H-NS histone family protein [Rhodobacteraceae bacterium MCCB 386]|nr:H-NS histone family protein [Roseitranquillus sediminis]
MPPKTKASGEPQPKSASAPKTRAPETRREDRKASGDQQRRYGEGQTRAQASSKTSSPTRTQKSAKPSARDAQQFGPKNQAADPKYRHPDYPELTWSGRGRRPRWITDAVEAGLKLDDLKTKRR